MLIFLQLDDSEYTAAAATKAKKTMELEIQDLQQQLDDIFRAKTEARLIKLYRHTLMIDKIRFAS